MRFDYFAMERMYHAERRRANELQEQLDEVTEQRDTYKALLIGEGLLDETD